MRRRSALLVVAGLLAAACSAAPLQGPISSLEPLAGAARTCPGPSSPDAVASTASMVAGYPDEPAAWHPAFHADAAAIDLSALWGLPLYHWDADGQLEPALVREAVELGERSGDWQVRLVLCSGVWSDGEPVVPDDVVATVEALRATPAAALVAPIVGVEVDGPDVIVSFDRPGGRWQHVLADVGSVLPAHVLSVDGIEAWRTNIPVSGGSFRLSSVEPGRSRSFVAHPGSPLGAPVLQSLEVLVVPRFELALGLLDDGTLDVALGHLALEPEPRIDDIEGLEGDLGRGNTLVTWQWQPKAVVADVDVREQVEAALDLVPFGEGLLDEQGTVTSSFVVGVEGPAGGDAVRLENLPEVVIASPRWHELTGLLARSTRDSLERAGMTARTASEELDVLSRAQLGDVHLVIRRLGPWPSLTWLGGGAGGVELVDAGFALSRSSEVVSVGQEVLGGLGVEVPLVEVGVAHAWADEVTGVEAHGWPGIGFTSASRWTRTG